MAKSKVESKLGEPYNQCNDPLNARYRKQNCIERCINEMVMVKNNCSILSYYQTEAHECKVWLEKLMTFSQNNLYMQEKLSARVRFNQIQHQSCRIICAQR